MAKRFTRQELRHAALTAKTPSFVASDGTQAVDLQERERQLYQQFAEADRLRRAGPRFRLCGLPFGGYPKGYRSVLSVHRTLQNALEWGVRSGLSAWRGTYATQAGYPPEGRLSRLWVEEVGKPATRQSSAG